MTINYRRFEARDRGFETDLVIEQVTASPQVLDYRRSTELEYFMKCS
ncbi:MAG: hypothetical protein GY806_00745 [Gammaproteobacteria bacterium]|nr:hypothetical protein [Gammaproteobacteria bacterium]